MIYKIFVTDSGTPKTGLTPSWSNLRAVADGADKSASAPAISEIGGGWYKFAVTPGIAPLDVAELTGVIDAGSTITNDGERYIPVSINVEDGYIDAATSSRSTLAAGAAMTLTADYEAAKTAAKAGDAMALTTAAIASVKNGLATLEDLAGALNGLSSLQITDIENILNARDLTKTKIDAVATEANATANKQSLLSAIGNISGGGSGTGTGDYKVDATITDGTNPLEKATVRFTEGVNTFCGQTDVNGQISFSLDAVTYDVTITKAGYSFTPVKFAVTKSEPKTFAMTQVVVSAPSNPDLCRCYGTVYDAGGVALASKTVTFTLATPPPTGIYAPGYVQATSSAIGFIEVDLPQGAKYKMKIQGKDENEITVPSENTYALPSY